MGLKSIADQKISMDGAGGSRDLAFLASGGASELHDYWIQRRSIICSVLGLDAMNSQLTCSDDSLLEGVVSALGRNVADLLSGPGDFSSPPYMPSRPQHTAHSNHSNPDKCRSGSSMSSPGSSNSSSTVGRLGPTVVQMDRMSASGQLSYGPNGLILESLNNFSSSRGSVCVYNGKWQYEAVLHTAGIQQIGWATLHCPFTAEEGVGDAPDSYAYDGKRIRKWNSKCQPYGQPWAPGDVIGALIDLDAGEVSFMSNGVSMGVAYSNVPTMQPHLAYFPALSLSYTERSEINFGGRPFIYPAHKYKPLQLAPSGGRLELGAYLAECVKRLALASKTEVGASSTKEAERPCLLFSQCETQTSGNEVDPALGPTEEDSLRFEEGSPSKACEGGGAGVAKPPGSPQLDWEDAWLLGSAIGDQIGAMLMIPPTYTVASHLPPAQAPLLEYFVHGQLLPALVSLHSPGAPHEVAATCAAGRLLHMGLETATFEAVCGELLQALASRCISAPLNPDDFPYSASYPLISLVCCLVRRLPPFKDLWLRHWNFHTITECLMSRKPPGPEDIKGLLPAVWWRGCRDETAAEERMKYALTAFGSAVVHVEDVQYELLTSLIGEPSPQDPSDDALMVFFRCLVQNNRGANRDIQPSGLSDPNVLVSVWFMMLRLLWGALGDLEAFPVGDLFVKSAARGDAEPTNDLPRLGGLLSFLMRESPVSEAEQEPISMKNLPTSLRPPPGRDLVLNKMKPEWVVELLGMSMALYSVRVVTSIRQIQSMLQSLAASIAGLEEVERHMVRRGMSNSSGFAMTYGMHPGSSSSSYTSMGTVSGVAASAVAAAAAASASSAAAAEVALATASASATAFAAASVAANASAAAYAAATAAPTAAAATSAAAAAFAASVSAAPTAAAAAYAAASAAPSASVSSSPFVAAYASAVAATAAAAASVANASNAEAGVPSAPHGVSAMSATPVATTTTTNNNNLTAVPREIMPFGRGAGAADGRREAWREARIGAAAAAAGAGASSSPSTPLRTTPHAESFHRAGPTVTPYASYAHSAAAAERGQVQVPASSFQHSYLQEARTFLRLDIASNGRCGLLLEATFYGGWKQAALMYQAAWVAHLLLEVSKKGALLSYVPSCYAEMVIDGITALKRTSDSAFKCPQELQSQGLDDIISFAVSALNDGHICAPDIKESLLSCVSLLLESKDFLPLFERNEVACAKLVPTCISMFDCRLWHPVSAILLRLTRGSGFGHGAQEQEGCSIKLRDILQRQLRPGAHPDFAAFLNRLFNTLNWALTDFAVSIADLYDQHMSPARSSSTSTRLATEEQQQQRKATVMFDLTVSLLRLLEYTALNSPEAFLEPGAIELTRLMELVPFILGHFTIGADAMRLTNILNHQQQNPASRLERNILADKISRAAVLAPIMGLLLGLGYADGWKRAKETGESLSNPASSSAEVRSSFVEILSDILDPRMGLKQLAYMRDEVQWSSSFPLAALPRPLILHDNACSSTNSTNHAYCNGFYHQRLPAALAHFGKLCEDVEAFKVKATSKSATVARAGGATGSEGSGADATQEEEEGEEEIPEEFVDPITQHLMRNPVILPDSQVTLDRSTIARHLLTQAADPFSRKELSIDMVKSDDELRDRIRAWQAEQKARNQ